MSLLAEIQAARAKEIAPDVKPTGPRFAAPNVRPEDWQVARHPIHEILGRSRPAVSKTPELARVLAIPRRPPLDLDHAQAFAAEVTARFARPAHACTCAPLPCFKALNPVQAWTLHEAGIVGGALGYVGVGWGKCVDPNTEFFDYSTASRRTAAEHGFAAVATFDKTLFPAPASVFPSGQKPCVTVKLKDGTEITVSTDHPILTQHGWVEAANLDPKRDFGVVATQMPEPPRPTIARDDEVVLLAYLLADGGCSNNMLYFTNETPEVIEEFQRVTTTVCGGWSEGKQASKARQFTVLGASVGRWPKPGARQGFREKWDLYGLAKHKRMHPALWGLDRRQVSLFINRFWACDGHVSTQGFECTLASEKLIDDVRFLLLRLGVRSRKGYKKASYVTKDGTRRVFDAWRICIYGSSAIKFLSEVGDVLGKEAACLRLRTKFASTKRNPNHDVVPVSTAEVQEICDELGMLKKGKAGGRHKRGAPRGAVDALLNATKGQYVSRTRFVEFCERWKYTGKYAHLATTDVAWERVVSVTDAGVRQVHDLHVPGTHNFVANGLVVHNTGLDILMPLAIPDVRLAVLLVPPSLVGQLRHEYTRIAQHFYVPSLVLTDGGGTLTSGPRSPWPALHVVPYSRLSRPESTAMLSALKPDLIISDEAHRLKDPKSAGTSRVLRYFAENPETKLCAWSGTLTAKSIRDYATLSAIALGENSPLPLDPQIVEEWSLAIDPIEWQAPAGALLSLCNPGEALHDGFRRRLHDTLGVTGTRAAAVDASITLHERKPPKMPERLADMLKQLRGEWVRPDGEELVDILQVAKSARELACGFFYKWTFPKGESPDLIRSWFEARAAWHKELREKLKRRTEHLDSPLLCAKAAIRYYAGYGAETGEDLPVWGAETWPAWTEIRAQVEPEPVAEWVDDYLAKDAAAWAHGHRGIVWCEHDAFGRMAAKIAGQPYFGGRQSDPDLYRRDSVGNVTGLVLDGKTSAFLSLKKYHEGTDGLQHLFCDQLIINFPSLAKAGEQLLGRIHRLGLKFDEVTGWVYRHTPELAEAIDTALFQARYIQGTLGVNQKLLAAGKTWE